MEITFSLEGKTLIIHLIGELDEHASEYARRTMDGALEGRPYNAVVFDLARLAFLDFTGIGVLIGRYKLIKKRNCPVYVKSPSPTVHKIFTMAGLYEIMPII